MLSFPTFPALLNSNYNNIDPVAYFDFLVSFKNDNTNELLAKFQSMDVEFDGFKTFKWTLREGLCNWPKLKDLFGLKSVDVNSGYLLPTLSPEFMISYEEVNKATTIANCHFYQSTLENITIGLMPGKRIAVIEMNGFSNSFKYCSK